LQADAFSCPDSGDFNNVSAQKPSIHALFENSVNAQGLFLSAFVIPSPVAKIANAAYCWGALKEKRTAQSANRKRHRQNSSNTQQESGSVTNPNRSHHAPPFFASARALPVLLKT
jgi:hypothetical protein